MLHHDHKKSVGLVINTRSRTGRLSFREAKHLLKEAGYHVIPHAITKPDQLSPTVAKLVKDGLELIVVGGGDGTISEISGELVNSKTVLGILPLGTANSFSRSLNIPGTLPGAIQVITQGKTALIDLGKINDHYFANAVSIGFASTIADDIPNSLKRTFGIFAYVLQCIRNLPQTRKFTATFGSGKHKEKLRTYQIVIANGGFYGPAPLVSKKRLQSADLSIFTFKDASVFRIFSVWLRSLLGKKFSEQSLERIQVDGEIELSTSPIQKVSIDGEIKMSTPIRISIAPEVLCVLVGEDSKLHT